MSQKYEVYWLEKGTVLAGKYEIRDVINESGFGIVYLGYDTVLNMNVAVKEYFPRRLAMRNRGEPALYIYKPASNEKRFEEGMNKFLNEARFLAQFHKLENVVTVRDFFYANKTAYIVSEHIVGESIKEYVHVHGRVKPDEVLKMMHPILRSLSVFHKQGLLHRDIAPDNIIFQGDKAVLIDFGAARLNDLEDQKSKTVFFKCGYSAVEQYTRKGEQGPMTDIYAICATMYYMLTGIQPMESVQRYIKDTVVPLTKYKNIRMRPSAKRAIMKGMSVSRQKRFASVEKLCEALYGGKCNSAVKKWGLLIALFVLLVGSTCYINYVRAGSSALVQGDTSREVQVYNLPEPAEEPVRPQESIPEEETVTEQPVVYRMPSVMGMSKKQAKERIRAVFGSEWTIHFRSVYSSDTAKGHVVSQSIEPDTIFRGDNRNHTVIELKVSKGKKKKPPKATPAPTDSPGAVRTPNTVRTPKTTKGSDYAGVLPW